MRRRFVQEALDQIYGVGCKMVSKHADVLLSIYARKDYNVQRFLTTKKDGLRWGAVTRRVVVDLDTTETISGQ